MVHNRDQRLTTQSSGVSTPSNKDGTMYYGVLEEILELNYVTWKTVVLFRCKWFKTNNTRSTQLCVTKNNITSINTCNDWWKDQQYILASQEKQVLYLEDPSRSQQWRDVQDLINLEYLDHTSLSEVGPSTEVEYTPTCSLVNDDDFTNDDELDVPHDFSSDSDCDSEDPDKQRVMALVQGRGHGRDNGPPNDNVPWQPPSECKKEKAHKKARYLSLKKKFVDNHRKPLPINFDIIDQKTKKHLKRSRSSKFNRVEATVFFKPRDKFNEETSEFPDLIDHFRAKHMKRRGRGMEQPGGQREIDK
nr:hypothetical protein [Tanacetum cinerariifolium]